MSAVVDAARDWIGTPYRHQASARGAGADCLGLVRGVWREVMGVEPTALPAYSMDWSEPQGEERLWQAAFEHLHSVSRPIAPGDVLLFRMKSGAVAKHLGIATGPTAFVHAYARRGVVESALSTPWRRRVVATFEFPLEDT